MEVFTLPLFLVVLLVFTYLYRKPVKVSEPTIRLKVGDKLIENSTDKIYQVHGFYTWPGMDKCVVLKNDEDKEFVNVSTLFVMSEFRNL